MQHACGDERISIRDVYAVDFQYAVLEAVRFRDMWHEYTRWEEDQDRDEPFERSTMDMLSEIRAQLTEDSAGGAGESIAEFMKGLKT